MLKMFRGRENGLRGGACRDSAQISRHLEEADTEALLDELMELTEAAANGDVDLLRTGDISDIEADTTRAAGREGATAV